MTTSIMGGAVLEKTRELCAALAAEPGIIAIRQRINAFISDDRARAQYEQLMLAGQRLQEKQERAQPLSMEEIQEFERQRDAFFANPVARGFLEAQDELHRLQDSIHQHITKTLELGRVPEAEDFEESCGPGCGCGH
ncbi:MAG: YlbF family regulator [Verrucomicrobiae bacterium]|nr:YlbF family regulator [Verrucomicrobiae bacterium]